MNTKLTTVATTRLYKSAAMTRLAKIMTSTVYLGGGGGGGGLTVVGDRAGRAVVGRVTPADEGLTIITSASSPNLEFQKHMSYLGKYE